MALFPNKLQHLFATLSENGAMLAEYETQDLQNRLLGYFERRLAAENAHLHHIRLQATAFNLIDLLSTFHRSAQARQWKNNQQTVTIFITGLTQLRNRDRRQLIHHLNQLPQHPHLAQWPLVIWVPLDYSLEIARSAPDFWLWKRAEFRFALSDLNQTKPLPEDAPPPSPWFRYVETALQDPGLATWQELYLPLSASRVQAAEAITPKENSPLTETDLAQLQAHFDDHKHVGPGETIFTLGDSSAEAYVILSGQVEILAADPAGNEVSLSRLGRGNIFGEVALTKNRPRVATVRSVTPCEFLVLTRPALRQQARTFANLLDRLTQLADQRLDDIADLPRHAISPLRRFAAQDISGPSETITAPELLLENPRSLLLGPVGAGKSATLRYLACLSLQHQQQVLAPAPLPPNSPPRVAVNLPEAMPLYLDLAAFGTGQSAPPSPPSLAELLLSHLQNLAPDLNLSDLGSLQALLNDPAAFGAPSNQLLFLFDGLPQTTWRREFAALLVEFMAAHPQHYVMLACRPTEAPLLTEQADWPKLNVASVQLEPLPRQHIDTFLSIYLGPDTGIKLAREIYQDRQLSEFVARPLNLFLLVQITRYGQQNLPRNRGHLLEKISTHLLQRSDLNWWEIFHQYQPQTPLALRQHLLIDLARQLQAQEKPSLPHQQWLQSIPLTLNRYQKNLPPSAPKDLLSVKPEIIRLELDQSGLLELFHPQNSQNSQGSKNEGPLHVRFTLPMYQAYFVALGLLDSPPPLKPYLSPPNTRRQWQLALILLYGLSDNRLALLRDLLKAPVHYPAIWLASQCMAASGESVPLMMEVLQNQSDIKPAVRFFSLGLTSVQLGRYPEALSHLQDAARYDPGSPEAQYELGALYRKLNQYTRALSHLNEAVTLRPDYVDAYNLLGITYYEQDELEKALTVLQATIQLEPDNAYHYYNLGGLQKLRRDYQAAHRALHKAVQLKQDYFEAEYQLDLLDRAINSGVLTVLAQVPMLSQLTLEQVSILADRLQLRTCQPGEIVYHLGQPSDSFYLIEYGTVQLLTTLPNPDPTDDSPTVLTAQRKAGDSFGEMGLLSAVPRTATVRCLTQVRLLELRRKDYQDIIQNYPPLVVKLALTSEHRLLGDSPGLPSRHTDDLYDPVFLQELLSRQNEVTIIMGDIHGSTMLTNTVGPEMMMAFLDEYLQRMSHIIVNGGGVMDKSLGDSVMGVFGKFPDRPGETESSAGLRALIAALQMRQTYLNLREAWKSKSPVFMKTGMGIGISTGQISIGTVGAEGIMVGSAVNMGSKLSKMAIKGRTESEVYLDAATYAMIDDSIPVERLDAEYVRQKAGGIELEVFRVVSEEQLD